MTKTDTFFKNLVEKEVPVHVFLTSGIKLQGVIEEKTDTGLLLRRDDLLQFITFSSISTVTPCKKS